VKLHELKPAEVPPRTASAWGAAMLPARARMPAEAGRAIMPGPAAAASFTGKAATCRLSASCRSRRGVGFVSRFKVHYSPVNLDQLAAFPAGAEVTPEDLALNGMLRSLKAPVAVLGRGELPHALTVKAIVFPVGSRKD